MTKRRGNNEGSIYQRNDGKWRAQITLNGHRLSFAADTRRECQKWVKETINQIDDGFSYSATKITLQEFLLNWLASKKESIRFSTYTQYQRILHNHIFDYLGKKVINKIHPQEIQFYYNRLLEEKVGIPTVEKVHIILHSAFNQAMKMGIISRNPVSATIPPRPAQKEMKILDSSQVSQMLITAKGHRLEALYNLAVTTGMRQMEILGLKWSDVDWRKKEIKVERQLVRPDDGVIRFSQPKTKYGRRIIALGSKTIKVLRTHYENQFGEIQKAGDNWQDFGLIFTTSVGTAIHQSNLLRNFKILLRDSGLPKIRFHDLRHTAASLMLNHGVPIIVVSRRLGHARPSITLDIYGHLLPSMQSEAAEMMDELVNPINVSINCTETAPKTPFKM